MMNKAGCILLSKDYKKVCLINRPYRNDYSFPKGHIEENENIKECAIRETEEETLKNIILLSDEPIAINEYDNFEGKIKCYLYLAKEDGPISKSIKEEDRELSEWINYGDVYNKLTYQNLKDTWKEAQEKIKSIISNEEK